MIINVPEICGEDIISREAGKKIRTLINDNWDQPRIEIQFGGKLVGSVSFFDEAIGLLMKRDKKTLNEMRMKLRFPDLQKQDKMLLNNIMTTRIREQEAASKAY